MSAASKSYQKIVSFYPLVMEEALYYDKDKRESRGRTALAVGPPDTMRGTSAPAVCKGGEVCTVKMELLENGCLKIVLTNEELEEMGLSFERLDYRNAETQRAIQQLLLIARQETGFRHSGDLTVEAIPLEEGCLLLLTPSVMRRRIRMKKAVGPYIYRVADVDGLFRLAESWNRLQVQSRPDAEDPGISAAGSSLYRLDDAFGLVLYPAMPLPREAGALLQEFAQPVGEGDASAAFTAEHGQPLAIGDALHRLWQAMQGAKRPSSGL